MAQRATRKRPREERIELRCDVEQKALAQRAAALRGESLSAFVLESVRRAAEETVRSYEVITLSGDDAHALAQALLAPPPPSPRFVQAVAEYDELLRRP